MASSIARRSPDNLSGSAGGHRRPDALHALDKVDPRKSRVVEMRFFGGLSVKETAEVLKVSSETVLRDWRLAKVWLLQQLSKGRGDGA